MPAADEHNPCNKRSLCGVVAIRSAPKTHKYLLDSIFRFLACRHRLQRHTKHQRTEPVIQLGHSIAIGLCDSLHEQEVNPALVGFLGL